MTLEETATVTETAHEDDVFKSGEGAPPPADESASAEGESPESQEPDELTRIQQENERLRRAIAADPQMSQRYEQEVLQAYGYQPPRPAPQAPPVQAPPAQQQPTFQLPSQLPFSPDFSDFDPTDGLHQAGLIGEIVKQQLSPALEYINQLKQEEVALQEQQMRQKLDDMDRQLLTAIDKQIPGYSAIVNAQAPTETQVALVEYANSQFQQEIFKYPQRIWADPRVQQEVLARVAPRVKNVAASLGLLKQPAKAPSAASQAIARESYVESSNAVPSAGGNAFDAAFEKDDLLGMIKALK